MRTAFIETLVDLASRDDRIWLLCGDLGFSVLERFACRFPDRFLNAGVAEQNMTGVAAGLAHSGKIVFTYSIANFPTLRCYEQIRNDVCYHNLNVKIVAVGAGYSYGPQGYTHHGVEDLAVTRVLPNLTVFSPADPVEAELCTRAAVEHAGPVYIRIGKAGEPVIHRHRPDWYPGRLIPLREGPDGALFATGAALRLALEAADALASTGAAVAVWSVPSLAPLDAAAIAGESRRTGKVLTIEEHGLGGLASAVAEIVAEHAPGTRFRPVRLPREPITIAGSQRYLADGQGLSVEAICAAFRSLK